MKSTLLLAGTCLLASAACGAGIDLNNNGLSDVYEFIYFNGQADPFADPDGDGITNYDEMFWGTNPTNAASVVTGPIAVFHRDTIELNWPAAPYRSYTLEASEDLLTWQTVTNGNVSSFTQRLSPPEQRFYRLSVEFSTSKAKSSGDGLEPWEEALYVATFGALPSARDTDDDGLNDLDEFLQGRNPGNKDHPAVGLILFTPLEK